MLNYTFVLSAKILAFLGFGHEHNRPGRDKNIKIHFNNINKTAARAYQEYK